MTLEEANKLKNGDLVLALVELATRPEAESDCWLGKTCTDLVYLCPDDIHSVYAPPRRDFRVGDIVMFGGSLREVEQFNPRPMLGLYNDGDDPEWVEADEVKLVCPVEERADRKEEA